MPAELRAPSLLWHDYESFGANPAIDFPAQFAAIRTDLALQPIAEPVSIYCQPPESYLPHPQAVLITGITPQYCLQHGLPEPQFAAQIHAQLARPESCSVGYNSMRFDEELSRQLLWRNFFPVYEREFQNSNARFDLIDVMRMAYALRPDGIKWPMIDGKPSFKLENLAAENALSHQRAHDALSDVEALLELARKLKHAQPRFWQHAFALRYKIAVQNLLDFTQAEPMLHASQRFGAERGCLAAWLPICMHPNNSNEVIGIDLAYDVEPWLALPAEELGERIFIATRDLPEGMARVAVKNLHLNRAPMLAPLSVLKDVSLQRISLHADGPAPLDLQLERAKRLRSNTTIAARLREVYAMRASQDRDSTSGAQGHPMSSAALYSGFVPDQDKPLLRTAREKLDAQTPAQQWHALYAQFKDPRLSQLLARYQVRNFPQVLSDFADAEHRRLRQLLEFDPQHSVANFRAALAQCRAQLNEAQLDAGLPCRFRETSALLDQLEDWARSVCTRFGLDYPNH